MARVYWLEDGEEEHEDFSEGEIRRGEMKEAIEGLKANGTYLRTEP